MSGADQPRDVADQPDDVAPGNASLRSPNAVWADRLRSMAGQSVSRDAGALRELARELELAEVVPPRLTRRQRYLEPAQLAFVRDLCAALDVEWPGLNLLELRASGRGVLLTTQERTR